MRYSSRRIREVAGIKQAALERIQTDIDQIDTSPNHKFIDEFTTEFGNFQEASDLSEILQEAASANLVWIGDYHALSRFQEFASEFLRKLYQQNRNIALGVEPVFARHQKILDGWMTGRSEE